MSPGRGADDLGTPRLDTAPGQHHLPRASRGRHPHHGPQIVGGANIVADQAETERVGGAEGLAQLLLAKGGHEAGGRAQVGPQLDVGVGHVVAGKVRTWAQYRLSATVLQSRNHLWPPL